MGESGTEGQKPGSANHTSPFIDNPMTCGDRAVGGDPGLGGERSQLSRGVEELWGLMEMLYALVMVWVLWAYTPVHTHHTLSGCILLYINYTAVKLIFRNMNDKSNHFLSTLIKTKRSHAPKDILGHSRRRTLLTK